MHHVSGSTRSVVWLHLVFLTALSGFCPAQVSSSAATQPTLTERWFFSFGYGRKPDDVERIRALIDTASAHGLNGMVLSSFGLDRISRWSEADIDRLKALAAYSASKHIELIPTGFSVGYSGGALGHDRNLAAALPTVLSLQEKDGRILPVAGPNLLVNGDLEEVREHRFTGYRFHDQPGEVSFADSEAASGKTAIRFEHFDANQHGHGRIMQEIAVQPGRSYRFTFKIKTRDLQPVSGLKAMVLVDGRALASLSPPVQATQDWTELALDFINRDQTSIKLYAGIWQGNSGAFWLDDLQFRSYGDLSDLVRRDGTPLSLQSRDRDRVFEEGRDFEAIPCLARLPSIKRPSGSSIRDREQLELHGYKIPSVAHSWGKQISLCMSNPELYAFWEAEARKLHEVWPFKRFLLSMDEIRNGGGCRTCRQRGLTMGEILGDCITRQHAILKAIDPGIEVLVWSDMLDPAHNAHDNYYGVVGDFSGSWNQVPNDLVIMCWYHKIRETSLGFFSGHGFRTFGAAYYDTGNLTNPRDWLQALQHTPKAQGIMYTTWEKDYRLLADFGDMVAPPPPSR